MALKLAGEEIGIQENIDAIKYAPSLQNSGDLEPGTKTITATSKQASPDYTANLTTPSSPDPRLIVKRLGHRLLVHIDSFGGSPAATKLYYSVEVNGVERATGEFSGAGADNPIAWDLTEGQFNLGSANVIEVFLWVDQGNAVISVCQLWQGVGTHITTSRPTLVQLEHAGYFAWFSSIPRVGTGTPTSQICPGDEGYPLCYVSGTGNNAPMNIQNALSYDHVRQTANNSVDTDLLYVSKFYIFLRSLQ